MSITVPIDATTYVLCDISFTNSAGEHEVWSLSSDGLAHAEPSDLCHQPKRPKGLRSIRNTGWTLVQVHKRRWEARLDGVTRLTASGMMQAYFALIIKHPDLFREGLRPGGHEGSAWMGLAPDIDSVGASLDAAKSEDRRYGLHLLRPEQERFRRSVFSRGSAECAFCGLDIEGLLDAAHIRPKGNEGADHPQNGIALCALHHRAFDAGLIVIHPSTLRLEFPLANVDRVRLRVTAHDVTALGSMLSSEALRWRYENPISVRRDEPCSGE